MTIGMILSNFPPFVCGVADYALNLANFMQSKFGIDTEFVICKSQLTTSRNFKTHVFSEHNSEKFFSFLISLKFKKILLHYVSYGYQKRGCPIWLIQALKQWKAVSREHKLAIMFHETVNPGFPWSSSFWLMPMQRFLLKELINVCDLAVTNTDVHARYLTLLQKSKTQKQIYVLPLFSNVGEPENLSELSRRGKSLVVFGRRSSRLIIYKRYFMILSKVCHFFGIRRIYDIGPSLDFNFSGIARVKFIQMGILPLPQISEILSHSLIGLLSTKSCIQKLGKSSILAAYCAHRMLVVLTKSFSKKVDGLNRGRHYLSPPFDFEEKSYDVMQRIADESFHWYSYHSLKKHAEIISML